MTEKKNMFTPPDIKTLQTWVAEAHWASKDWRSDSWRDSAMYDGDQWGAEDLDRASDAGVDTLTINRTFPVVNLIRGTQVANKFNITAKARTARDAEMSQVMSEGIQFVMDQSNGQFILSLAFKDSVIPGFGCLAPGFNQDPRKEKLRVAYRDWKEIWWDPYGSPWLSTIDCRYVFNQRWMELAALQAMFPKKEKELAEYFADASGGQLTASTGWNSIFDDEATQLEQETLMLSGSDWTDAQRSRVRPAEMWYTLFDKAWFASFADGRVIELTDDMDPSEQYQIIQQAQEVVSTIVRRMRVATFLGEILLQDMPSPFPHDQFPFIPFIGYIDRYKHPYGVPRQIREQDIEINKRRSMAMALLSNRRTTVEEGIRDDQEGLMEVHLEANKPDGFVVVKDGRLNSIKIEEHKELAASQIAILSQSEAEIQQISGANAETMGYQSNAYSGRAIEKRQMQGNTVMATLFDNFRYSATRLGEQVVSLIQGTWTHEKVLRITDRLSGAEKFLSINQQAGDGEVKNNITQGKYDVIVSEAPQTDTVREKNLELVMEWVKKSPPEVIPQIIHLAFEMSDLPNKDQLLARMKPLLGIDPTEEDLTAEEIKEKAIAQLEAQKQAQQAAAELQQQQVQLEFDKAAAEIEKTRAETQKIINLADIDRERLRVEKSKIELDAFKLGHEMQSKVQSQPNKQTAQGGQRA